MDVSRQVFVLLFRNKTITFQPTYVSLFGGFTLGRTLRNHILVFGTLIDAISAFLQQSK